MLCRFCYNSLTVQCRGWAGAQRYSTCLVRVRPWGPSPPPKQTVRQMHCDCPWCCENLQGGFLDVLEGFPKERILQQTSESELNKGKEAARTKALGQQVTRQVWIYFI
jgi:hypothetical protein